MAQTFNERFEAGTNTTALSTSNTSYSNVTVSNATAAFDNSVPALGSLSAKLVQTSAFGTVSLTSANFTGTTTYYDRLMMYFDVLPTTSSQAYFSETLTSVPAVVTRIGVNFNGKLIINDNGTTVATSTTTLTTATHYRFEIDIVGTSCSVRIYTGVSGAAAAASTTIVETVSGTIAGTTFNHYIDGILGSGNNNLLTWHMDEVVRDSAATPGPAQVAATSSGSTTDGGTGTAAGAATASGSTVDGGTGTARGAATASGSTVDGGSGTARGAATASGATSNAGSGTARAAVTATGGTIVNGTASAGIAATAAGGTVTVGLANATFPTVLVFRPPYRDFDPPVGDETPEEQIVPAIYFTDLIPKGINVFLTIDGTLTEEQPALWDTVNKVYWGGHENYITADEAALISAVSAEYAAHVYTVPAGRDTPPPTGVGSGTGGSGGSGGSGSSGNYGDGNYGDGNYGG